MHSFIHSFIDVHMNTLFDIIFLSISPWSAAFVNHLMEMFLQLVFFLLHIHSLLRPLCLYLAEDGVSTFLGIMMTDMKIKWRHYSQKKFADFAEIRTVDFLSRNNWQLRPLDHSGHLLLVNCTSWLSLLSFNWIPLRRFWAVKRKPFF